MKRKHSVCLGIACLYCILFAIVFFYDYSQFSELEEVFTFAFQLPFIITFVLGFVFAVVAFFTNLFGLAIAAGVLFSIDVAIGFRYLVFMIPLVPITFIGCAFCYKYKKMLKEQEEERHYQQRSSQAKNNNDTSFASYGQRQGIRENRLHQSSYGMQDAQSNPYQHEFMNYDNRKDAGAKNNVSLMEDSPMQYSEYVHNQANVIYEQYLSYGSQSYLQNREETSFQPPQIQHVTNDIVPLRNVDYNEITPSLSVSNGFFDDFGNFQMDGTR